MEAKDDVEAVGDISFKRVSELIDIIGDYLEKGIEIVKLNLANGLMLLNSVSAQSMKLL